MLAEVEDAGSQHAGCATLDDSLDEVLHGTDTATGDDGHVDVLGNGRGEVEVVPVACAVTIHRGQQDLAGTEPGGFHCPVERVDSRRGTAAVQVDLEPEPARTTLGVDRANAALRAELGGDFADQLRSLYRRGVDADLVGAGAQHAAGVVDRADTAAYRQRNEHLLGGAIDDVDHRVAPVGRRSDVEEDQFVGALGVVARGQLDRVTRVAQPDEVDALDHAAAGHVEARDDPGDPHRRRTRNASTTVNRPS